MVLQEQRSPPEKDYVHSLATTVDAAQNSFYSQIQLCPNPAYDDVRRLPIVTASASESKSFTRLCRRCSGGRLARRKAMLPMVMLTKLMLAMTGMNHDGFLG